MSGVRKILSDLGIKLDQADQTKFKGRNIRYVEARGVFQVGDSDFDRWANSVDFEIDITQKKGVRAVTRWINDF